MRPRVLWTLLLLNLAAGLVWWTLESRPVRLIGAKVDRSASSPLGVTPDFLLLRQDGIEFGLRDLLGHPWVGSFLFTRCPYQCPMLAVKLAMLQKDLPPGAKIISFSVDPANDTPAAMTSFGTKFAADFTRWHLLTGQKSVIASIQRAWNLSTDEEPSLHTLRLVLVDKKGAVRGYYNSDDGAELAKLRRDVDRLDKE